MSYQPLTSQLASWGAHLSTVSLSPQQVEPGSCPHGTQQGGLEPLRPPRGAGRSTGGRDGRVKMGVGGVLGGFDGRLGNYIVGRSWIVEIPL